MIAYLLFKRQLPDVQQNHYGRILRRVRLARSQVISPAAKKHRLGCEREHYEKLRIEISMSEVSPIEPQSDGPGRHAYVVVGMHRSGTSAMTRTLSLLGARLPKRMFEPQEDNKAGFWEASPVALLNDEILETLDSEWDDVFSFRPKTYLSNFDRVYLGRAVELLEQEFDGSELIVLKDPRISVLTTFWARALGEAGYKTHYVVMVRNPLEVAESLRVRNGFPREKSFLLWSSYMIAIDRDTRCAPRTFVSYDQLMNDWRSIGRRIETDARLPFPRQTAAAAIEIDRFLDPRMRHHTATPQDLFARADVPEQVKALYRIFSQACEGEDVDLPTVHGAEVEIEKLDLLVGPLLADLKGSTRTLSSKVAELSEAQAGAREQLQSLGEELTAERALRQTEAAAASQSSADHEARLSGAREQLQSIEEELTAERALRQTEAAAASQSSADYEARLSEIMERIDAAEVERDRLALDLAARDQTAADLAGRLAHVEADRNRLTEEVDAKSRATAELAEHVTELRGRLTSHEEELETTRGLFATAKAEIAAKEEILAQRIEEVANLTELLKKSAAEVDVVNQRIAEVRENAEAAARASESKLKERFEESATLTKLLKQQQERGERTEGEVDWLLAINKFLAQRPWWWNLFPRSWGRRRTLKDLRAIGLFDGESYLERYPDVEVARRDPLAHYLQHGYHEGRSRS
jgi:hypothetical protein